VVFALIKPEKMKKSEEFTGRRPTPRRKAAKGHGKPLENSL